MSGKSSATENCNTRPRLPRAKPASTSPDSFYGREQSLVPWQNGLIKAVQQTITLSIILLI